jgi:predicted pyridoxine 5'-phosphate oxidase superfamily flavin-nucleotide-binding protein
MNDQHRLAVVGFHSGELAAQQLAGVRAQAARLARMVGPGELRGGMAAFVGDAQFAALTARDRTGRLWTSPLLGPPGFLEAWDRTTLRIGTSLPSADPLHWLPIRQPAGVVVIDFHTRRRVRINGVLTESSRAGLTLDVDQAYGNCPQYIQQRRIHVTGHAYAERARTRDYRGDTLPNRAIQLAESADTFFLGTTHPDSGNDASHRGGPPGFVSAAPDHLSWPDYPGNNMFNSFDNLAGDPTAALLFVDFPTGKTLQISGTATVDWHVPVAGDDGRSGRRVRFTPLDVIVSTITGLSESSHTPYPHNPGLTDHRKPDIPGRQHV